MSLNDKPRNTPIFPIKICIYRVNYKRMSVFQAGINTLI